jgi:hypothetical protein
VLAVCACQSIGTIIGDRVELVEFIFAEPFGAKTGDAKTETSEDQNDERGEDKCAAVGEYATTGKEVRP